MIQKLNIDGTQASFIITATQRVDGNHSSLRSQSKEGSGSGEAEKPVVQTNKNNMMDKIEGNFPLIQEETKQYEVHLDSEAGGFLGLP